MGISLPGLRGTLPGPPTLSPPPAPKVPAESNQFAAFAVHFVPELRGIAMNSAFPCHTPYAVAMRSPVPSYAMLHHPMQGAVLVKRLCYRPRRLLSDVRY
eukprot:1999935-Rhodomonas_salina.1